MRRNLVLLGLVCASQAVQAQEQVRPPQAAWQESPQFFVASPAPVGEHVLTEGEFVFRAPTRWLLAGRLERNVSVIIEGEEHRFTTDQVLPQLLFMPDGTRRSGELAFCTPRDRGENATRSGIGGALFGGSLWDSLARSLTDKQFCLTDSDGDGLLDASLLLGQGEADFVRGPSIDPVVIASANEAEISAADEVRIKLVRVGRRNVDIALEVIQQGHNLDFTTIRSGRYSANNLASFRVSESLPVQVDMFGVQFAITAFDREAGTATITWPESTKLVQVIMPDNYNRSFSY